MHNPEVLIFSRSFPEFCHRPRKTGDYSLKDSDFIPDHIMLEYGMYILQGGSTGSSQLVKRSNRHRVLLCPVLKGGEACHFECESRLRSGITYQCKFLRKTAIEDPRQPLLPSYITSKKQANTYIHQGVKLTTVKEEATGALLTALASTSLKFIDVDRQCFRDFCKTLIEIGQHHPTDSVGTLMPETERHLISDMLCQRAVKAVDSLFTEISNLVVSIQFDSATINHKQLMLITITVLTSADKQSHVFQLGPSPASLVDYLEFLENIFECLRHNSTTIGNICTDGCPVQRAAIFDYLKQLRLAPNKPELIPNVIWCHNHLLNLITQHIADNPITVESTVKMTKKIQHFATRAHRKMVRTHLHAICPTFIPSRWLSLWCVQSFIRLHRSSIVIEKSPKPLQLSH